MRRMRLLVTAAIALVAVGLATALSLWLVLDVHAPDDACAAVVPYFEQVRVVRVRRSLAPPLIRCTVTDPRSPADELGVWGWEDVAFLAAVDLVAAASLVAVHRAWRSGRRGREVAPRAVPAD